MNNKEIIEEVLNNPKNHGTGTINLIEKALAMKDEEFDGLYIAGLREKDAEHLEFLENYMKELTSTEAIIQHEVPDYFPLDDLKKRLRIEISLCEFEGEEKIE